MRKTILTIATLLGGAPAAVAAGAPLVPPVAPETSGPGPRALQLDLAHVHHRHGVPGRDARALQQRRERRARARKAERARAKGPAGGVPPQLQAIAQCESGGNPSAIGGGGQFRGKYQFTYETWAGVGGTGDPAAAPEGEQDRRAAQLYARSGAGQWPVCSQ